jgi:hypothetical protein
MYVTKMTSNGRTGSFLCKPNILVLTVCLFIFYFIAGEHILKNTTNAYSDTVAPANDHFMSYSNLKLGIEISYFPNFTIQETSGNSIFILGPNGGRDVLVEIHLYRDVPFEQIISSDDPYKFMHLGESLDLDKKVATNESSFTFKGHPSYRYDYFAFVHKFDPTARLERVRSTEIIVSRDNDTYSIYFSAPFTTYSKYLHVIMAMVNSIDIINEEQPFQGLSTWEQGQRDHFYAANSTFYIPSRTFLTYKHHISDITIGIVKPTFTAAAYNNAFYNFYELFKGVKPLTPIYTNLSLLTGKIPSNTHSYIASFRNHTSLGAYDILKISGQLKRILPQNNITVITDSDIDGNSTLSKSFDILVLGHQEYVTQQEYNNLKTFVKDGGLLICLDGNIFYAEVKYNRLSQTVTLISGHYHNFNGKEAWIGPPNERWERETSDWFGSNFYGDRGPGNRLSFLNNPFGYSFYEEQYVSNPDSKILFNYGAIRGISSPPVIATYQKIYGLGKVIVFGIYSDMIIDNPTYQTFFSKIIRDYAIPSINS